MYKGVAAEGMWGKQRRSRGEAEELEAEELEAEELEAEEVQTEELLTKATTAKFKGTTAEIKGHCLERGSIKKH